MSLVCNETEELKKIILIFIKERSGIYSPQTNSPGISFNYYKSWKRVGAQAIRILVTDYVSDCPSTDNQSQNHDV